MLFALLERRERLKLLALGGAMILMGIVEMVGVASVLPFMQLVADPDVLQGDGWQATLYDRFGFQSPEAALFAAGVVLLLIIAFNNGSNALTIWFMHRFAWGLNHRFSTRLLARYLSQPYPFFLGRNTADLNRTLLGEVNSVVTGVVLPALQVAARAIAALLIVLLLAVVNLRLAVLVALGFGGAYGLVYAFMRRSQYRLGWERFNENGRRFTVAGEALSGIKDVKALGREREFMRRFSEPSWKFSLASARNQSVARIPRYALETIGFGGILVIILYVLSTESDIASVLPLLSLYAFAGYRLMPALNELFSSVVTIRFNTAALDALYHDLVGQVGVAHDLGSAWLGDADAVTADAVAEQLLEVAAAANGAPTGARAAASDSDRDFTGIELRGVDFRYPGAGSDTLAGLDLKIEPNQTVGFVGVTGVGKTTLVDLVLGLLEPSSGAVVVDGQQLGARSMVAWRTRCGYVPQDVFLSDDSIAANIAFGIPHAEIDGAAVERAARTAQLHEFVASLPDGYDTVVGERGVRMSGGQRQRIGIARALYHDPDVLVLDEATSALDGATESAVIETINTLGHRKTILVIAHRMTTVQACDVIHLMQDGRIVASGTYEQLQRDDPRFQAIAGELGGRSSS